MKRLPNRFASADLIPYWRQRFAVLSRKLGDSPGASDAWYWLAQSQIIHYLLRRYGGDVTERMTSLPPNASHAVHAPLDFKSSDSFARAQSITVPPKDSRHIAPILKEIEQANEPRYEAFRKDRAEEAAAAKCELEECRVSTAEIVAMLESPESTPCSTVH